MKNDLMKGRPMKFRILEIFSDGTEMWSYEAVKILMEEYGCKSNFRRDSINFDLIEVMASGFIEPAASEIDESGKLRQGALLYKYKITELGLNQYNELVSKVKPKKGVKA